MKAQLQLASLLLLAAVLLAPLNTALAQQTPAMTVVHSWDFEDGAAGGWAGSGGVASTAVTTEKALSGTHALKLTKNTTGVEINFTYNGPAALNLQPEDVVRMSVWIAAADTVLLNGFQGFWMDGGWNWHSQWFNTADVGADAWATIEFPLSTLADPFNALGFQALFKEGATTLPAVLYVDDVQILRAGEPEEEQDPNRFATWSFEDGRLAGWLFLTDGYASSGEIAEGTAFDGTHSVRLDAGDTLDKAAFANDALQVNEGDTVRAMVWVDEDQLAGIMGLQIFVQHGDSWAWTDKWFDADTLTTGAWNMLEYVVPADLGATRRVGIQITEVDAASTPTIYIDQITVDRFVATVARERAEAPRAFRLEGNYPNPFSGETTIVYTLEETSPVQLTVFDALGREVRTIADGIQNAGEHRALLSADELPSGLYFYRLETQGTSETGRMALVR